MRAKVWLVMLAACGITLTACDKEDELAPVGEDPTTSATFQDKPGDTDNNGGNNNDNNNTSDDVDGSGNNDESGDESFNSKPTRIMNEQTIMGEYSITYFAESSSDMTSKFAGTRLNLRDGKLVISSGRSIVNGSYLLVGEAVRFEHSDVQNFKELSTHWKITEATDNTVTMLTPWMDGPRYQMILTRIQ